ncbi:hypothetical protein FSP39_007354 [Pinctada imbricata]|uniref:Glycine N-acyltransferase-like protein n=1 Tax=Pinctada imbricata TaxID=66713 RepID=A0AA88Y5U9_PINIB|nr:hypothetical protein FSP39_007354 [Pinctada imbricata]
MIYKVLCSQETEELRSRLEQYLPGTAKIFYVIQNVVLGHLKGFEVIVDKWPDFNCILLRPRSKDEVLGYFRHTHICYGKSVSALKYFLQRPGLINWKEPINFTGVPNDLIPVLTEVSKKHGGQLSSKESRFMYAWSKSYSPELPKLPEGMKLMPLKQEHASEITKDWAGRGNRQDMESYFRSVIENFESSCLLDEDGRLVAYVCMHYNGSMAMVYVRPENRDEGYFHILLSDLTRKILAKKQIAYGFIPVNDTSLIKLCREIGFEWVPQGNMTWSCYTPRTLTVPKRAISDLSEQSQNISRPDQSVDEVYTGINSLLTSAIVYP